MAEFLIVLGLGVLLFRTFAAEAYVVPTGSMAPTLLGHHREVHCPHCLARFAVGLDDAGSAVAAYCGNCGAEDLTTASSEMCGGDRLLVQKYLFDLRPPRRWEPAVFQLPDDPNQTFVKRVVGLPGEQVLIHDGDLFIDGKIARKSLAELRAMRMPVYDLNHPGADEVRFPRWVCRRGEQGRLRESGWIREQGRLRHEARPGLDDQEDWLFYRHWDHARQDYGPIRDDCAYNGIHLPSENKVRDLYLEVKLALGMDVRGLVVRLASGGDVFRVTIPTDGRGPCVVRRNGKEVEVSGASGTLATSPGGAPSFARLEAAVVDRQLHVALDGNLLFDPIPYDDPQGRWDSRLSAVALGVLGGAVDVAELRIARDVHYTTRLAGVPAGARAVEQPYQLGPDEFFMLGDNSPLSNDSRFWAGSGAVRRRWLVGKPFLVHLPSQMVRLKVFGDTSYRVPDLRAIRYIR